VGVEVLMADEVEDDYANLVTPPIGGDSKSGGSSWCRVFAVGLAALSLVAIGAGGGVGLGYHLFHHEGSSSSHAKVAVEFYGEAF